jgi:hypothetical protein
VRRVVLGWVVLVAALATCALPAQARTLTFTGAPAPGPAKYDRVSVEAFGPAGARTVLVLIPGTGGGAGNFAAVAGDLAKRVKGLQVWSFDRREQAFEDTSGFAGDDLAKARSYYLGFKFRRTLAKDVPFVAEWGFATELNDLHRVIRAAGDGGRRRVILGGHSRGASSAVAYAAWDFAGRAGHRDLDGLVLIDGGLAAFGPQQFSAEQARSELAKIRGGEVFNDPLGAGVPEAGPIFAQLLALYARKQPGAASPIQDEPIIPAMLRPPFPVTNEGFLGYIFDKTTSPASFAALRLRAGKLAAGGDPRPWVDGELTPIQRFARVFARTGVNATEWYYPRRMVLDTSAANALRRTPAADALGLRLFHTKTIALPLYVIQTDLTGGGVLRGARTLMEQSRIRHPTLVDAGATMSHLDPLLAAPDRNRFLQTVVPFLRRVARAR